MNIIIGIMMILFVTHIDSRKPASRNREDINNREDYGPEDITTIFDFAEDSDSDEEYADDTSPLERSEEQMMLEALLQLIQTKYQAKYPPKKPYKKEEDLSFKQKEFQSNPKSNKNRQPSKNRYNNDRNQNNYYPFYDSKKSAAKVCKMKGNMCMRKCDWADYPCRHACSVKYQC